jgi:hypothetical protein
MRRLGPIIAWKSVQVLNWCSGFSHMIAISAGHSASADAIRIRQKLSSENILGTLDHLGENVASLEDAPLPTNVYFEALTEIEHAGLPLSPLLVCAPLIATARILPGMHFQSDIVPGALLGAAGLALASHLLFT